MIARSWRHRIETTTTKQGWCLATCKCGWHSVSKEMDVMKEDIQRHREETP